MRAATETRSIRINPQTEGFRAFTKRCQGGPVWHAPLVGYIEKHHITPQGWQLFWLPPGSKLGELWLPETIDLCRNCHGNVHYWLARFMRTYNSLREGHKSIENAVKLVQPRSRGFGKIKKVAILGMTRWEAKGGSIQALCDKGLWGGLYGEG